MKHVFRFNGFEYSGDVKNSEEFTNVLSAMLSEFHDIGEPQVFVQEVFGKDLSPEEINDIIEGSKLGLLPCKVVWIKTEDDNSQTIARTESAFIGTLED